MTKLPILTQENLNILFTCINRSISLLPSFRKAAKQLKISVRFFGADRDEENAALQLCDKRFITKSICDPAYIPELLEIIEKNHIGLIIPTTDLDLMLLTKNKDKFGRLGCHVLISSQKIVKICQDKRETYRFFVENGFDTPVTITTRTALSEKKLTFPRFIESWDSYAHENNAIVKNRCELEIFCKKIPNCIVQEIIEGVEYICDIFVDFDMKVRCVVPRKRTEERPGEVCNQIVKNRDIMTQAAKVVETLGAGPGIITIHLILNPDAKIKFVKVNPKFEVGVSTSIEAGANFPKWILQQLVGIKPNINFDGFKDKFTRFTYYSEVWGKDH